MWVLFQIKILLHITWVKLSHLKWILWHQLSKNRYTIRVLRPQKPWHLYGELIYKPDFSFSEITKSIIVKSIIVESFKNSQSNVVPKTLINKIYDILQLSLLKILTNVLIPVYKRDEWTDKNNYRRIHMLSMLSKSYERYIHDEMNAYFDNIYAKFQCGSRKVYSSLHCLLYMIKN